MRLIATVAALFGHAASTFAASYNVTSSIIESSQAPSQNVSNLPRSSSSSSHAQSSSATSSTTLSVSSDQTISSSTTEPNVAGFIINGLGGQGTSSTSESESILSTFSSNLSLVSTTTASSASSLASSASASLSSSVSSLSTSSSAASLPAIVITTNTSSTLYTASHQSSVMTTSISASQSSSISSLLVHSPILLSTSLSGPISVTSNATQFNSSLLLSLNKTVTFDPYNPPTWPIEVEGPAASCYTAIWNWHFSSSSLALMSGYISLSTHSTWITYGSTVSIASMYQHDVTTLCDGHPRAIGPVAFTPSYVSLADNRTVIITKSSFPYSSMPCQIVASDCKSLWSSYSRVAPDQADYHLPPPCATTGTLDLGGSICRAWTWGLLGEYAQLIYWPIRYTNASSQDKSAQGFCANDTIPATTYKTPITAPGTRTGDGPNTFVTAGVTITSPDVGIYISNLRAWPDCGTSVDTVLTIPASELRSIVKAPWLGIPRRFDLNDLNWVCEDRENPNAPWTTQFTQDSRCYQDVPATAYFSVLDKWDQWASALAANETRAQKYYIMNDYNPAIDFVQQNISISDIRSVFGPRAYWAFAGVWDPVLAITPVTSLLPASSTAVFTTMSDPTTTAAAAVPQQSIPSAAALTSASPQPGASSSTHNPSNGNTATSSPSTIATVDPAQTEKSNSAIAGSDGNTALPSNTDQAKANDDTTVPLLIVGTGNSVTSIAIQDPSPTSSGSGGGGSAQLNPAVQTSTGQLGAVTPSNAQKDPAAQSSNLQGDPAASLSNAQKAPSTLPDSAQTDAGARLASESTSQTSLAIHILTFGSSQVTVVASGSNVVIGSATLLPGQATTINGQQLSLASHAADQVQATTATIAGSPFTISDIDPGLKLVNGQVVSQGAVAQTLPGGVQVSLGTDGLVVSSGMIKTTIASAAKATTAKVADSSVTISDLGPGSVLVDDRIITQGGAAQTLPGGMQVSLGSNGLLVSSGSIETTIAIAESALSTTDKRVTSSMLLVTVGGVVKTLGDGQTLSVAGSAMVVGNGRSSSTLALPANGILTINGQVVSIASQGTTGNHSITATVASTQSQPALYRSHASRRIMPNLSSLLMAVYVLAGFDLFNMRG